MGKTTDKREALQLFKKATPEQRPDEDSVASNMAKQRAARLARDANGHPPPELDPGARVAKRSS